VGRVVSDKIFLREYDPKRPRFNVEGEAEGADDGGHNLEVYRFPARSVKEAVAKQFAEVLLDSLQCRRDIVDGSMTSWSLSPGYRFSIEGHPLDELNAELLTIATTIEHFNERSQTGASALRTVATFEAIPTARSKYRPERLPRARTLAGVQTGNTTGASGQEVHVDENGCVNVQFPWDREGKNDETSSLPMRTLQLPTGGSMLLPRVGWEVFVQHDEGDVDLPFVTARVYNALTPPPYALPAGAARSAVQTATTRQARATDALRRHQRAAKRCSSTAQGASVTVNNNRPPPLRPMRLWTSARTRQSTSRTASRRPWAPTRASTSAATRRMRWRPSRSIRSPTMPTTLAATAT
jgi:type VI secretion system secreted protein VgrG